MFDFITALWIGFIGACVGSFLNVVAYRLPLGMSVVWKPSHCPKCKHPIRARDNVPVLGWLLLRGRCRDCGTAISARYAIVEAVMGAAFFVLAYAELFTGGGNLPGGPFTETTGALALVLNPQWNVIGLYAYHAALMALLTVMTLIALDRQPLPRKLIAMAVAVGIVLPVINLVELAGSGSPKWWVRQLAWTVAFAALANLWARFFPRRVEPATRPKSAREPPGEFAAALITAGLFLPTDFEYRVMFLATTVVAAIVATITNWPRAAAVWAATLVTLLAYEPITRWLG